MSHKKLIQSNHNITIFDFDNSNSFSLNNSLNTTTQGHANFTLNPRYSCSCRRGYGLRNDPFNVWKMQEEINHYSRGDFKRAYRLGGGF